MTARQALEWAFGIEHAQLDLPDLREVEGRGFGFGTEYILIQRARLGGVRIDGGGRSFPHDDADIIASIVAAHPLPRMAIRLAECARSGMVPDWMPGATPKIEPVGWTGSGRSHRAATAFAGYVQYQVHQRHPKNPARWITRKVKFESLMCPITCTPHPEQIKAARRGYRNWWEALNMVRGHLKKTDMLSTITITDGMPPRTPWAREEQEKQDSYQEAIR